PDDARAKLEARRILRAVAPADDRIHAERFTVRSRIHLEMRVHWMPGNHIPVDRPRVVDRRLLSDPASARANSEARVVCQDELSQITTQGCVVGDRVRLRAIAKMARDVMEDE